MKGYNGKVALIAVIAAAIGSIAADVFFISGLQRQIQSVEKQIVVTTNKLASARIAYENLNHVQGLVYENMEFPNGRDTGMVESGFYEYMTICLNDLKLKLISMRPMRPVVNGKTTEYVYAMEIEGAFFSFGELCAKLENSKRIVIIKTFDVSSMGPGSEGVVNDRANGDSSVLAAGTGLGGTEQGGRISARGIRIKMVINAYRIRKA